MANTEAFEVYCAEQDQIVVMRGIKDSGILLYRAFGEEHKSLSEGATIYFRRIENSGILTGVGYNTWYFAKKYTWDSPELRIFEHTLQNPFPHAIKLHGELSLSVAVVLEVVEQAIEASQIPEEEKVSLREKLRAFINNDYVKNIGSALVVEALVNAPTLSVLLGQLMNRFVK